MLIDVHVQLYCKLNFFLHISYKPWRLIKGEGHEYFFLGRRGTVIVEKKGILKFLCKTCIRGTHWNTNAKAYSLIHHFVDMHFSFLCKKVSY